MFRRDRTRQLDALARQIITVLARLARHGIESVDVRGALCFPYMRRGMMHFNRARDGLIIVDDPRHVAKLANRPGDMNPSPKPLGRAVGRISCAGSRASG